MTIDHFLFTVRTAGTGEAIARFVLPTKTKDDQTTTAGTFIQTFPKDTDPNLHGRSLDLSEIGNPTSSYEKPDDAARVEERALAELRAAYPETDIDVERSENPPAELL